jgi:hypothetical protein
LLPDSDSDRDAHRPRAGLSHGPGPAGAAGFSELFSLLQILACVSHGARAPPGWPAGPGLVLGMPVGPSESDSAPPGRAGTVTASGVRLGPESLPVTVGHCYRYYSCQLSSRPWHCHGHGFRQGDSVTRTIMMRTESRPGLRPIGAGPALARGQPGGRGHSESYLMYRG